MIKLTCHDCGLVLGYAYLEENYRLDKVDSPFKVQDKPFIRCGKCYGKFQKIRKDLNHTRIIEVS